MTDAGSTSAPPGGAEVEAARRRRGGVQSIDRALLLLEVLAADGGRASLTRLSQQSGLPAPTIHRLLTSLVSGGYVRREPSRGYALGPSLVRLGVVAGRTVGPGTHTQLARLVAATGETANLATLEGSSVLYLAQAPSRHSMRMFTEVGRRVAAHCTGVGKALLARLPIEDAQALARDAGFHPRTEHTISSETALAAELEKVRAQGFAVDDEEQELGVRCVAAAVPLADRDLAVSVSAPTGRLPVERVADIAPLVVAAAAMLAPELG